jgi:transcriptional regulator with XRE-family HTH domain
MARLKSGVIYKLEKGMDSNPKLKTLAAIANALGIPISELILED